MNARLAMFGPTALIAALVGFSGGSPAHAEVVFGNLGPTGTNAIDEDNNSIVTSSNFRAHGFVVGGTNRVLQSIALGLESDVSISARVQIFADSSGSPTGSALGTATEQVTISSATLYTFAFPNLLLDESSTYWAVVSALSAGNLSWSYNAAAAVPGPQNGSGYTFVGTLTSSNAGSSWGGLSTSGFNTYPAMSISAVPEPSTYVLAATALGLCGIAAARRRRAGC
jgi:hypothetical protein